MNIRNPIIRQTLDKIIKAYKGNRELLQIEVMDYTSGAPSGSINAQRISDLSFNHLYDDSPERFGITQHDALCLREYFTEDVVGGGYDFVMEMHQTFSELDDEGEEFIELVNRKRAERGLKPLVLSH